VVHEDAVNCLRPAFATSASLSRLIGVIQSAWDRALTRQLQGFFRSMYVAADHLLSEWERAAKTEEVEVDAWGDEVPRNVHKLLYEEIAKREPEERPSASAVRIVLGAVGGDVSLLAVAVDPLPGVRAGDAASANKVRRTLYGVSRTPIPEDSVLKIS